MTRNLATPPICHETSEGVLIKAFDRLLRSDHANKERKGCPGIPTLKRLAFDPKRFRDKEILSHLGYCGACVDELAKLRKGQVSLRRVG